MLGAVIVADDAAGAAWASPGVDPNDAAMVTPTQSPKYRIFMCGLYSAVLRFCNCRRLIHSNNGISTELMDRVGFGILPSYSSAMPRRRGPGSQLANANTRIESELRASSGDGSSWGTVRAAEISADATRYAADSADKTATSPGNSARSSTAKSLVVTSALTVLLAIAGIAGTYYASSKTAEREAEGQASRNETDYLRQQRTTAYVDFAASMQDVRLRAAEVAQLFGGGETPGIGEYDSGVQSLRNQFAEFAKNELLISFVASEDVRNSATDFQMVFGNYFVSLTSVREMVATRALNIELPGPDVTDQIASSACRFQESARVDLSGGVKGDC